jgi:GNAT superfamily N-acetyltransferase
METRIRPALLSDLDAIRRIYRDAVAAPGAGPDQFEEAVLAGGLVVAEIGETPIGFGSMSFDAVEQIRQVYVIPRYQRSSLRVGLRILEAMEEAARQRGLESVRLHATPNAVRFYEKAGYSIVPASDTIGHDHPGVEMRKQIT